MNLKVLLLVIPMSIVFLIQGCSSSKEERDVFILLGESEHWTGTVTIKLTEYNEQPDYFKNSYSVNDVITPKNEMKLKRLTYNTSFNIRQLGQSGSDLIADENEILNQKSYGDNSFTGGLINWTYEELKNDLEYAKIEIEWTNENGVKKKRND